LYIRAINLFNFAIAETHSLTVILNTFSQDYGLGYNYMSGKKDAFPLYFSPAVYPIKPPTRDSHGTAVAGIIAGVKNNSVCGVGVAYHATLAGKLV